MTAEIPQALALRLLVAAFAGNEPESSYIEVRPLTAPERREFVPVRDLHQVVETVERLRSLEPAIGVAPRVRRRGTAQDVERVWCLAADLDNLESVGKLRAFRPLPSVVAASRTAGNLHAYWQLAQPIPPKWARRATFRIAKALGSDASVSDPARVMRAPASFLMVEPVSYQLGDVVGRLLDDPRYLGAARRRVAVRANPGSASALLDGLVRTVREAASGERNNRLNWASYRAGGHVGTGTLDPDDAHDELLAAALEVGLPEPEAETTIRSGLHAGTAAAA